MNSRVESFVPQAKPLASSFHYKEGRVKMFLPKKGFGFFFSGDEELFFHANSFVLPEILPAEACQKGIPLLKVSRPLQKQIREGGKLKRITPLPRIPTTDDRIYFTLNSEGDVDCWTYAQEVDKLKSDLFSKQRKDEEWRQSLPTYRVLLCRTEYGPPVANRAKKIFEAEVTRKRSVIFRGNDPAAFHKTLRAAISVLDHSSETIEVFTEEMVGSEVRLLPADNPYQDKIDAVRNVGLKLSPQNRSNEPEKSSV